MHNKDNENKKIYSSMDIRKSQSNNELKSNSKYNKPQQIYLKLLLKDDSVRKDQNLLNNLINNECTTDIDAYEQNDLDILCVTLLQLRDIKKICFNIGASLVQNRINRVLSARGRSEPLVNENHPQASFIRAISRCALQSQCLTEINLSGIKLRLASIKAIGDILLRCKTIECLTLYKCYIGDKAAIYLLECMKDNQSLFEINMSECNLTDETGIKLNEVIKYQINHHTYDKWASTLRKDPTVKKPNQGIGIIEMHGNISFL